MLAAERVCKEMIDPPGAIARIYTSTGLIGVYIKIEPRGQQRARTLAPPVPWPSPASTGWTVSGASGGWDTARG